MYSTTFKLFSQTSSLMWVILGIAVLAIICECVKPDSTDLEEHKKAKKAKKEKNDEHVETKKEETTDESKTEN